VLIVYDNADSAESLATLVRTWGHEVATAHDGAAALALAERFKPDSALVDIGLPVMDGYELARRLRAQARHHELYLVAMTGYGRSADRHTADEAGFDVHLMKPADIDQLRRLLGGNIAT
jgi:two-component system, sensor histidine kinase